MPSVPSYLYQATLMGSNITLKFYERQDEAAKQAFSLIKQWEDRLTINRPAVNVGQQSEIAAVNAAAGQNPVQVSKEVFTLLKKAQAASFYPNGCFNFAIGPVVKAWNIGFAAAHVPSRAELSAFLSLTNPQAVQLDSENFSVFLPQKGMALDLGAIAKGFIADCVKAFLKNYGIQSALINLGGNVHSLGTPFAGIPLSGNDSFFWTVGLQKPFAKKGVLLGLIHIADKSVVTSGIYERYFIADTEYIQDNRLETASSLEYILANSVAVPGFYHHIFDPRTGYPLHNDLMGVTVISENSVDGEIWSSLLYGMGAAVGTKILYQAKADKELRRDKSALQTCNDFALPKGLTAIFITKDRQIILPAHNDLQFTLLDKTYHVCFS